MSTTYAWRDAVHKALHHPFNAKRARRITVDASHKYTPLLHCLDCGACCRARNGTILIVDADLEKWKADGYAWVIDHLEPGHFGQLAFKMTKHHRCVFQGTKNCAFACRIYGHRATICREFEIGCPQCFDIRRNQHDFEPDPPSQ